jgi:hypothetical protein
MKKLIMAVAIGSLALTGIACGGGSACQAAADSMAACGATYAATLDTAAEETTGDEVAAAECVDDASTDDWYNCMADAYDAGDCGTMDGMVAAGTAAAACAATSM